MDATRRALGERGSANEQVKLALERALAGRSRTFLILAALGLLARAFLAATTLVSNDMAVFGSVIDAARDHVPLYRSSTFSYPPVFGYYFEALGRALQAFGIATFVRPERLLPFVVPNLTSPDLTTLPATLAIKLPALVLDIAAGASLGRVARRLGFEIWERERLMLFWWLNPMAIWSCGIAGTWDAIVPLAILEALVAAHDVRWFRAGATIAFGALSKLVPLYALFALAPYALEPRAFSRAGIGRLAALAAGGTLVAAIVLAPILAWHEIEAMRHAIFTRVGVFSPGGMTLLSFLQLGPFGAARAWVQEHHGRFVAFYGFFGLVVPLVVAGVVAYVRPAFDVLVVATATVVISLVMFSPFVQPTYVVWFVPLTIVLYRRDERWWPWLGILLGAIAAGFAHAVRGTDGIAFPACVWYRICDASAVAARAYAYHTTPGLFSDSIQIDIDGFAGELGGIAIAACGVLAARRLMRLVLPARERGGDAAPESPDRVGGFVERERERRNEA